MNSESELIADYKEYQKRFLPNVRTLDQLYWPDFDADNSQPIDLCDLTTYVNDLREYSKRITVAAQLRQTHYEKCLQGAGPDGIDLEDTGHRAWRRGMNEIADDCAEKLAYWSSKLDEHWTILQAHNERNERNECKVNTQRTPHYSTNLTARNTEYSFYSQAKEPKARKNNKPNRISAVKIPKLSAGEKRALRREYREQLLASKRLDDNILETAIKLQEPYYNEIERVMQTCGPDTVPHIHPRDMRDYLISRGFDRQSEVEFTYDKKGLVVLDGEDDEMVDLAILFYDAIRDLTVNSVGSINKPDITDNKLLPNPHSACITEKCRVTDLAKIAVDNVTSIFEYLTQQGPFGPIAVQTLLNLIILDSDLKWSCTPTLSMVLSMMSLMNDDDFICNYEIITNAMENIKPVVLEIMRSDISREEKTNSFAVFQYRRLYELCQVFQMTYPGALYHARTRILRSEISKGNKIHTRLAYRSGHPSMQPVSVNYRKIIKALNIKLAPPASVVELYTLAYKEFMAFIK